MKKLYKSIVSLFFMVLVVAGLGAGTAFAQFTILPSAGEKSMDDCKKMIDLFEVDRLCTIVNTTVSGVTVLNCPQGDDRNVLMGCAIKTGRISLKLIPYFISYFANFLLSLVGLISMLFIVIGGYFYIYGGLTENKEKGKKTIYHALLGMAVAILSWVIINVIISAVTS